MNRLGVGLVLSLALGLVLFLLGSHPARLPLAIHTIRADDSMLRHVRNLGASHLVQVFSWHDIQPSPARWDWEYTDWLVRSADAYELEIIARLDKPPAWAVGDSTAVSSPPREMSDYTEFVRRVAERYRGKIAAYIVWNEPNLAIEWGNARPDARAYAGLLSAASETIRAADPNARILAAALAPTNENSERARDDRDYLRELYAMGIGASFDALAAHPYAFARSPDAPRDANSGLGFSRLLDWRDIMVQNGDAAKSIWITEFGYPTQQPPGYEDRVVPEELQARYTARAYEKTRAEYPFVSMFTVWNIVRDLPPTDEQTGYSLFRADGTMKPGYASVHALVKQPVLSELGSLLRLRLPSPPQASHSILARDTVIHLGDSEYPAPFVPLYKGRNPSIEWKGEFYLGEADLYRSRRTDEWTLSIELMQVNDFDTRVWVNDVPAMPSFLPAEDFTSKWVTARFKVPVSALFSGHNAISIHNGKLHPAFQQTGFVLDEFQIRNVRLVP